ncbi:PhzF family phenazine biosynthesis protein [Methylobacterium sp. 77]|uniref:PhzF family phenazine biosynthesis protein n=1 Tax=Methylobacterium sp. 77 TaxID=1101192 RepID=UPI000371B91B|nr:PhzF family phenazine biosynthesis protein [Methylobacterium sp. 77]
MSRRFVTLDVFTETPFSGNPLAVVLDSEGLDDEAMQRIAGEFNLSETVFVLPPTDARHKARLRIFTPARELAFAGHPTLGVAILLALRDARSGLTDAIAFGLEEAIGTVACVVEAGEGRGRGRFKLPVLPGYDGEGPAKTLLAKVIGLEPQDIGFGRHVPSRHTAGPSFIFIPVNARAKLDAARLDMAAFSAMDEPAALYLYAVDPEGLGHRFHARMFAPHLGITEDPATGSAAAAFAGVMMEFEPLGDGEHDVFIRQGLVMGRPSAIALQMVIESGALQSVEIGGSAVVMSEGTLLV